MSAANGPSGRERAMMGERVQVNGVELAYEVHGSLDGGAVPLLLAHGFTGSRLDWIDVIDRLAASRPVVAYDHRGHGEPSIAARTRTCRRDLGHPVREGRSSAGDDLLRSRHSRFVREWLRAD